MFERRIGVLLFLTLLLGAGTACSSSSKARADDDPTATTREPEPDSRTSAQELFITANDHLDARRWEKAIATYKKVVDRAPERWDAHLNMAIALSQVREFQEALEAVDKSLANGGEGRPEVYYNLGNIYQKRGLYEQAVKAYRTSLAHAPGSEPDVDTLVNIGTAFTVMGRRKAARKTYRRAQSLAPEDPRIQHGFAILHYADGQKKKAIRAFEQLEQMAPDYARAYFDRAIIMARLDRFEDAVDSLETYLQKASDDAPLTDRARNLLDNYRQKVK